jgi:hypothetical protein
MHRVDVSSVFSFSEKPETFRVLFSNPTKLGRADLVCMAEFFEEPLPPPLMT